MLLTVNCTKRRFWNLSTQRWLARYVYRALGKRPWRRVATFAVSAYWHGVDPGFYLFFLQAPMIGFVENKLAASSLLQSFPAVRQASAWVLQHLAQCWFLPAFYLKELGPVIA